nr:bifunctional diguanylate cyclase/phosphodiesterase [Solirubrobacterales bacterium]
GDEFTILCEDLTSDSDAETLAARFSAALGEPYIIDGVEVMITASIGVAFADHHRTAARSIEDADAAMYKAKERGRNRIEIFDERTRDATHSRLTNQTELRHALDAGEFVVHYQPIRSLDELNATGVEALVRRRAADGSLIGPERFIGLAEETGLIIPLGSFVLTEACQQAQLWRGDRKHESLGVSVNVSARQISHGGLVDVVMQALGDSELPAEALTLEITESTLMGMTESPTTLRQLRDLGVAIAIDDFGTGYSSLDYLRRLPIDVLKLDQVFLQDVATHHATEAIVSSTVKLANTLGLDLVAEGIETNEQLDLLRHLGCPQGQGFHLGRPADPRVLDFDAPAWIHAA